MPCATVHLLTAGRTLDAWRARPVTAPFDPSDPRLRSDFLTGAMAPDMGFVAAVDRTVSELAHYVSTGDLVTNMMRLSRSEGERAFAWGWATHHLTDVMIHPLVGLSVGEVLYGDSQRRVNASENEEVHVSVEVGLDILILLSDRSIPAPANAGGLLAGSFDVVARAVEHTYSVAADPARLAGDLRLSGRQISAWPNLLRWLGSARGLGATGRKRVPQWVARTITRAVESLPPQGSALRGLLSPRMPPAWLPVKVRGIADEFPDRFQEIVRSGLVSNRNLETGLLEGTPADHPNTDAIHRKLANLRRLRAKVHPPKLRSPDGT